MYCSFMIIYVKIFPRGEEEGVSIWRVLWLTER